METNFNRQAKMQNSISNKDKEVKLYEEAYNKAIQQRNVGYTFGFLSIILGLLSNIL